jgi:hypothetical protein
MMLVLPDSLANDGAHIVNYEIFSNPADSEAQYSQMLKKIPLPLRLEFML